MLLVNFQESQINSETFPTPAKQLPFGKQLVDTVSLLLNEFKSILAHPLDRFMEIVPDTEKQHAYQCHFLSCVPRYTH